MLHHITFDRKKLNQWPKKCDTLYIEDVKFYQATSIGLLSVNVK